MGCLPSQAAVIVALTWLCVLTASAAALGEACNTTITCQKSNETCQSDVCACKAGFFAVSEECKSNVISVTLSPATSSVVYGSDVNLTATIKSDVPVSPVIWQRVISNGTPQNLDTTNGKYTQTGGTGSDTVTLTINNVNFSDDGTYQVFANNTAGNASTSTQVIVTVTGEKPIVEVSDNLNEAGTNVTIPCNATVRPGSPLITSINWFINGNSLNISSGNNYSGGNVNTPSLTIHNLQPADGGVYRCSATNLVGTTHSTATVTLAVPSSVMISVSKNPVYHGQSLTFNGSYSSDALTVTDIKWQKQDGNEYKDINITESNYTGSSSLGPNPKLVIQSVMFTDETSYRLIVSNRVGLKTSDPIQLDVIGGNLTAITGENKQGRVGGSVTIHCNITGPETKSVLWKKFKNNNQNNISVDNRKYTGGSVNSPALTINDLQKDDAAEYQCTASNPGGSYSSSNKATVTLVYGEFDEDCSGGKLCDSSKHLFCSNINRCMCNTNFYHKNKTCYPKAGLTPNITQNSSYTTSELNVKWSHPIIQDHLDLVAEYEVHWRVGRSLNMSSGRLNRTLNSYRVSSGLIPGQLYTVTVIAHVILNNPVESLKLTSPDQTVRLDPLPPGDIDRNRSNFTLDNLHIVWTAPINDTVVNNYEVTIQTKKEITSDNATSINFNAAQLLFPGMYYNVTIVTVSGTTNDIVKKSSPSTEQFRTTPTKPYPPTDVRCTQVLDTSIVLSWTAPSNPNGRIEHYQINITTNKTMNTPTNATHITVGSLYPEQPYDFTVSTVNDALDSISYPSGKVSCKTIAKASTPPTELEVVDIKSRKFNITFEAPDEVNGVLAAYKILIFAVTGVKEQCVQQILVHVLGGNCPNCKSTDGCPQLQNVSVTNISLPVEYTVTDLNPYTKYLVEVAAVNGFGEGHRVNKSAMTEEEIPQRPDHLRASNIKNTSLTLSWNLSDPPPGVTTYTIYVYKSTDDKGTDFTLNQTLIKNGFDEQSVEVSGMEEYWPYNFKVNASTAKGSTTSNVSETFRTLQGAPGHVEGLTVKRKGEDYTKAYVSWNLPPLQEHNGVLENYVFISNFTGESNREELSVDLAQQTVERNFQVTPERLYNVQVALKNNESMIGDYSVQDFRAPAGPPPLPNEVLIATKPGEHAPTESTIDVKINYDFFKNDQNGKQVLFGIAVCAEPNCDGHKRGKSEWSSLQNWHTAKQAGFTMYRVTNETFMEKVRQGVLGSRKKRSASSDPDIFTIGNDTICSSLNKSIYCNGPLNPETSYKVIIFACTNGGCTQSDPTGPFATKERPEVTSFPLGIVIGVVGAVVAVALIVGAVIIIRKRSSGPGRAKSYREKLQNPDDIEDPVNKNIPRKRPIKLKELAEKVAEKHKDSNLHFAREYDDLKALCAKHSTETSETDSNKLKNRYVNILPFDHSRVKLMLTEDDDPSTDFINANYLPGYKSPREYIATQGPIPGTIDDFWRMIWEQNVSIIVMLTLCKEEGRVKCEMYWPENTNEPKQYGDLVVETVSNSTVNFYDFRIFKIKLGDTTRSVKHFHFLQWKDFSANVQNDVMIDFIKNVRNHIRPPDMNGPVVVHCSAGVGRTGTYCALDHLFQFIDEHELDESIDIFDLVMNLREQRMCMVQTEQQYVFIHDCVRDYVERKQREMNGNQLYENVNRAFVHDDVEEDESLYQNYNNQRTDL